MAHVAFVTYSQMQDIAPDDQLVVDELAKRQITVTAVPWESETVDWKSFDLIVLRSTWNYFTNHAAFIEWLNTLEGLSVWNPVKLVQWNSDKSYLSELALKGVATVPTIVVQQGVQRTLEAVIMDNRWLKAVVKPTISGGAYETWMTEPQYVKDDQPAFNALLKKSSVMIQPFIPEVANKGEWSFIFFDKQFSHCVLKKPRPGDFRVQEKHGGSTSAERPPQGLLDQAQKICNLVEEPLLYTRVDGVEVEGKLLLMELEIIEPVLFLRFDPLAPIRFADAIEKYLDKGSG